MVGERGDNNLKKRQPAPSHSNTVLQKHTLLLIPVARTPCGEARLGLEISGIMWRFAV
jgi:hypothetical protein